MKKAEINLWTSARAGLTPAHFWRKIKELLSLSNTPKRRFSTRNTERPKKWTLKSWDNSARRQLRQEVSNWCLCLKCTEFKNISARTDDLNQSHLMHSLWSNQIFSELTTDTKSINGFHRKDFLFRNLMNALSRIHLSMRLTICPRKANPTCRSDLATP